MEHESIESEWGASVSAPMHRRLNIAPEVAQELHSAYLADAQNVAKRDMFCTVCRQMLGEAAELVVFRDRGYRRVSMAHPQCLASGIYDRPGLRAATEAAPESGKTDLRVLMFVLPSNRPSAVCAVEPTRLHGTSDTDPVENFAMRLHLPPLNTTAKPRIVKQSKLRVGERGLEVVTGEKVRNLSNKRAEAPDWIKKADADLAWLIVGRALNLDQAREGQTVNDLIAGGVCCGDSRTRPAV
jgi:hypothetical protein